MSEFEKYKLLNSISIAEAIQAVITNNINNLEINDERDVYYTAKQLIELYPNIFSKYKIAKYIKEDNLPVIKQGKERYFLKSSIESWLEDKKTQAIFRSI